jgi:hypothetical protein
MMTRRAAAAVLRRPSLWIEAVRTLAAVSRDRWWRRPPFLPVPNRAYSRWRVSTAYGRSDAAVDPEDVVAYLRWRRRQRMIGQGH